MEVEAYGGPEDRASHARFGRTARNAVMFGRPGIAYVYLVYGMYDCLNVVCGTDEDAAAVLIRAIEPLAGIERMRADRAAVAARRRAARTETGAAAARARIEATPVARLASGPGRAAAAFGVDTTWTGIDLCDPAAPLRLESAGADADVDVVATPRVGVGYAGEAWAGRPWRFALRGHPSVSGPTTA